ncbi:AEC family transporter [Rhizobium sp. SSA_523]|uniref:AEC family transporter n=1 Tax=Rhizobium sp. SSA_523 TaxID=2952477 RepID=UPI0020910862|nr:AEC family transporter [Rhizobium sp. SSA_523]MCO5733731.1 AEC family transporter [Rhizobium sp. SSA_523]WKC24994.1 AEC family transporter [Rhizobium sp. SSA_523]
MAAILALLFPFFGLIVIGYIAAKATRQGADALGWMNTFIVYAALPALFFKLVSRTPVEDLTRLDFMATQVLTVYAVYALVFLIAYLGRRASFAESTMQAFGGAYGNIGYMGPGLALLALGEGAAVPVALIVCVENAVHFVTAPALMALAGGDKRPPLQLAGDVARRVALHPFILSTAAGFLVAASGWSLPDAGMRLIDYLAQAAAPCALFAMGVTLALRPLKRVPVEIGPITLAKLVLLPAAMYLALTAVGGFDATWIHAAVLLAALPTATNVFVISQHYDVWQERASATVLITTIVSILTLPVVLYLISAGLLPAEGMF